MRMKNVLGLMAVAAFAIKGGYSVYKYYTCKCDFNQAIANVGKDAMDGVNDIVKIFSDNAREVELCDAATEICKGDIDILTEMNRQ